MYRPQWIEPDEMLKIGYQLVSDKDGYLKYENIAGHVFPHYGKSCVGKRILYFNCTLMDDFVFLGIQEDGGTRTVFHGVIDTQVMLKLTLDACI